MVILEIFCSFSYCQIQLGNTAPVYKHRKKVMKKVFCLLLLLTDSQAIFATKLKSVPDDLRWREALVKLLLGEIEERWEKSEEKMSPSPYKKLFTVQQFSPDECWQVKKCDCRCADMNQNRPIYLFIKVGFFCLFVFVWFLFLFFESKSWSKLKYFVKGLALQ